MSCVEVTPFCILPVFPPGLKKKGGGGGGGMAFKLLVSVLYILLRVYLEKGGVPGKKRGAAPPFLPLGETLDTYYYYVYVALAIE